MCFPRASPAALLRCSRSVVLAAGLQAATNVGIAGVTSSGPQAVLATISVGVALAHVALHRAELQCGGAGVPGHGFLVAALTVVKTWLFFLSQLALLSHNVGLPVLALLFDSDTGNDLSPASRAVVGVASAALAGAAVADAASLAFHAARLRGAGALTDSPRLFAWAQALADAVGLAAAAAGAPLAGGAAAAPALALYAASLLAQARHARALGLPGGLPPAFPLSDAELSRGHVTGALLALQHALVSAAAFNALLAALLLASLGRSLGGLLAALTPASAALSLAGVGGYAAGLVAAVAFVGVHAQVEGTPLALGARGDAGASPAEFGERATLVALPG